MDAVFKIIVVVLVVSGLYYHLNADSHENVIIEGDAVTVDVVDYVAKFSVSGEFQDTYMLFGGSDFRNKKLISPIWLAGLGIVDAKEIYARYPDFHRCKSPGASLAKPKVEDLNLIPADKQVLDELKLTIKEFNKNFRNHTDRVCVSLIGNTLDMQSAEVPGKNIDIKDKLPRETFHLINSSKRINCKNLLEQPFGSTSEGVPQLQDWVTDLAGIFTDSRRDTLIAILARYEEETSHQIAVLAVDSLRGEPIKSFSLRVANTWGLGQRGLNNGILVTVSPVDRAARIEIGLGLEEVIPVSLATSILQTHMFPAFRRGDYEGGIEAGVKALMTAARRLEIPTEKRL